MKQRLYIGHEEQGNLYNILMQNVLCHHKWEYPLKSPIRHATKGLSGKLETTFEYKKKL